MRLARRTVVSAADARDASASAESTDVEELYRQHRAWLLRFLRRRFGDRIGEDLVQEAFVRTLGSSSEVRHPRAFLIRVAINAATEARSAPKIDAVLLPEFIPPVGDEAVLLKQAILALPKPLREVFLLSRFGQLSNVEIAHRCNLSVKRVEARITKARQMCTALMRD